MIGNSIIYISHKWHGAEYKSEKKQGIVVDAFTKISGNIKGDSAFGFGDIKGRTNSERMYKVMYYESWDSDRKYPRFEDISADSMSEILKFGNNYFDFVDEKIVNS